MRVVLSKLLVPVAGLVLAGLGSASDTERHRSLALSLGEFGMLDTDDLLEVGVEYRHTPIRYEVRPIVGFTSLEDGSSYAYGGLRYEWNVTRRLQLAPSFAAGLYSGNSVDLGGTLEFRSGLSASVAVTESLRVGASFYHLSNGGLYDDNSGSESLVLTLAYAF